ncbi:hypothetical protein BpJC7_28390 [Weizmannia acidilactici]|uniref:Uncharacterized protein n=1 Tax=Weizmannia acidilactici TaxID=2607726 RepID=A0A5J4J9N9_9BACI|nr:hypothetical protein [Weizmannia acidilactici]GER71536.1 hypothetical protein BpJC7_28390 [Weizmannia acidilactici]
MEYKQEGNLIKKQKPFTITARDLFITIKKPSRHGFQARFFVNDDHLHIYQMKNRKVVAAVCFPAVFKSRLTK